MKRLLLVVLWCVVASRLCALSVSVQEEIDPAKNDSAEVLRHYTHAKDVVGQNPGGALLLLEEAELYSLRSERKYFIGDIYALKGNVYRSLHDDVSALKSFQAATHWYKRSNDSVSLAGVYVNISRVCAEMEDSAGYERYLKLADNICPTYSKDGLRVKNLVQLNSGVLYFKRGLYKESLGYFLKCLEISRETGPVRNLSLVYNNMAMAYSKLNEDKKAAIYADSALANAIGSNESYFLAIVYSTHADLLVKRKEYANAIVNYKKSMDYGRQISTYGNITVELNKDLSQCYYKLKDYKNALKYHEFYMQQKDSAYNIEKLKQLKEVELRYKLEQKNATIAHLNRQNILKSELANRQYIIIVVTLLSLALVIALMLLFMRYTGKIRKLNGMLREKSNRIIEQNKCIEAQKAMLQKEANKLEGENTIAQFEILKNQVNPHMLFNALAVLKSIIDKDKSDAKGFVDDLAKVYRQALELKSNLLVKLGEELSFVESYINIISKQYENCFTWNINIPEVIKEYYIPPFSLQLIVENVIKHNELSEEQPVHMQIFYTDGAIQIDNTLARKKMKKPGPAGLGHQNLINRYKLVSEKAPLFISDETFFSVRLPLFIDE